MNARIRQTPRTKGTKPILMGLALAAAMVIPNWLSAAGPEPVDLLSTANFTILAGAGITSGPGIINGDVGASPIAGSGIGIPAAQVNGIIYKTDASGEAAANIVVNPGLLTTAKGDLTTAYNQARDMTPVPTGTFLDPNGGNIGGEDLVPGLYKFTGSALITGTNVTLTGGPNDVWIFQIAADLQVGNSIEVILAGGARAKNIFWQVGTSAVIGTSAVFKGTILADQSITLGTSSTLEGRALASVAGITFDGAGGDLPEENAAPVAVADAGTVGEGGTMTVLTTGPGNTSVLDNDTDADSDPLTAILVDDVTNGALTLNADGTFSYTHDGSETVSDLFTYKANDSVADSNTVTVTITVTAVNDAPVAVADAGTVDKGGTMTVLTTGPGNTSVLDNDTDAEGDPLTAILVDDVTNGALTLNADGTFSYTHNGTETTTDSFTYKANDGTADSNTVAVTITISPDNKGPVAVNDSITTPMNTPVTITVLDNDTDPDGNPLTVTAITDPINGTAVINPDYTILYTPDTDYLGLDAFTYTISDGEATDSAMFLVKVGDAAGADDSDMSLAKMACTINWAKHAKGIPSDTLAISGCFNPRGIMLNLNNTTVTIVVNGVQLLLPVPLGSKGTAVGNPTYNYRVKWKNGYYSFMVKGLDLRTVIGVPNETATMPHDLTMTVTVADADLDVPLVVGTFECQSVTKVGKTSKLTFKNKSDSTLTGVYQSSSTRVYQKGTVHNITAKGLIEAEGGGSVIPIGDITVKIGDTSLVIPFADLVVKNDDRSYKGTAPGITKFSLQNSKHAFSLTAVQVVDTGIPLGNFDAPESYRLQVQIQVPTADGLMVFDSIVEILRSNGNAKAWKR
jgi:VCBS repeat-containing protein